MFISETVHPNIRGSLLVLPGVFTAFGIFFIWLISYYCPWNITSYISMITPFLTTISMFFLPETPYWLIESNQPEAAK